MSEQIQLTTEQKTFIVRGLARFLTPTEVAAAVKEEFDGFIITRQSVRYYNPDQSPELAAEWRTLFEEERKRAIESMDDIGTAHKAVRLRELDAMFRKAKASGNVGLAKELLEQIAKEEGGAFTNRRELTGKDGGKVEVEIQATVADYREAAAALAPPDDAPH